MTFELATAEQVVDRNRYAGCTLVSVQVVLPAVARAIAYAQAGHLHDALVTLNGPLMGFEPVRDLLCWFYPPMADKALHELAVGNPYPLGVVLDAMGLLPATGPAYARARQVRERARAGL